MGEEAPICHLSLDWKSKKDLYSIYAIFFEVINVSTPWNPLSTMQLSKSCQTAHITLLNRLLHLPRARGDPGDMVETKVVQNARNEWQHVSRAPFIP